VIAERHTQRLVTENKMLYAVLYLVVSRKQDSPAPLSHKSSIENYFVALFMIRHRKQLSVLALMSIVLLLLEVVVPNVIPDLPQHQDLD
jgi:hypothetical protein